MFSILHMLAVFLADLVKSRSRLEAENVLLRHQLNVALRKAPARLRLRGSDRAIVVWLIRVWPNLRVAVQVVKPETVSLPKIKSVGIDGAVRQGQAALRCAQRAE